MHTRQGLREVPIAFIGDNHAAARFRNQEIRTRDANISGQKAITQFGARFGQDVAPFAEYAILRQVRVHFTEGIFPIFAIQMEGGRNDMGRMFAPKLDDVFAKIGFNRFNPMRFQMVIDPEFFGDHGFALGDGLGAGLAANLQHRRAGFIRRGTPMHRAASRFHIGGVCLQIEIQISQRVVLDVAPNVAQLLEFRQARHGIAAALQKGALGLAQSLLQPGIANGAGGVFLELRRGDLNHGGNPIAFGV